MTFFALGLVLASGLIHATWNLLAKRAGEVASGPAFVWLCSALSAAIFAPLAAGVVFFGGAYDLGGVGLVFVLGTGALHIGYFLSLQHGYRVGDLSVVYPLARVRCSPAGPRSSSSGNAPARSPWRAYS